MKQLAWLKDVVSIPRERRQWIRGKDAKAVRERAAELRQRVLEFKMDMRQQGVAFRTDRDAWMAFWNDNPGVHLEFAGQSADEAIGEYAYAQFRRIWNSEEKIVRFAGDGIIANAPMVVTLGEGATRVRADIIEALKLTDPEERARAIIAMDEELKRIDKDLLGRTRRKTYLLKAREALESGAVAIEQPNGEVIVQGLLSEQGLLEMEEMDGGNPQ